MIEFIGEVMTGIINKDLLTKDYPWLDSDIKKGRIVYKFTGYTYGCIGSLGTAVTLEYNSPFLEIPVNSVTWNKEKI